MCTKGVTEALENIVKIRGEETQMMKVWDDFWNTVLYSDLQKDTEYSFFFPQEVC